MKIILERENTQYRIIAQTPNDIQVLTGGHVTINDKLVEMGRKYFYITNDSDEVLIEEGDEADDPIGFRIWFWVDDVKTGEKYFIDLKEDIYPKIRTDEMPQLHNNEIIELFQSAQNELQAIDTEGTIYKVNQDGTILVDEHKVKESVLTYLRNVDFNFWCAKH